MSDLQEKSAHIAPDFEPVTDEQISKFFEGADPLERIVSIELPYDSAVAEVIYYDENGVKKRLRQGFKPFCWAKNSACVRMCQGNRLELIRKMREYGIGVKALYTCTESNPNPHPKLYNGYKYLFFAKNKMSMGHFQNFFREVGTPLKNKKRDDKDASSQEFMTLQPVELFMIQTGKRYFKGYDNYDDIHRTIFDLETTGTKPRIHRITQIGVSDNRGFKEIINIVGNTPEELRRNELAGIARFLAIIGRMSPDVLFGHNSENFDWDFLIVRCQMLGADFTEMSKKVFTDGIYKKKYPTILKLGGEVETYYQTVIKYTNVVDSIHAVRRAMATDSSFENASLKYATKHLHLNKPNRVYVDGAIISKTWAITDEKFAFNDENGDWYQITEEKPLQDGYQRVTGKYVVERYLYDDLWEADKVELTLHETDFQLTKIMPTTFMRVSTMGTATQWKLIMLDWAYQHNLAVPALGKNQKYTGGLSRLLITGFMTNICKGDYAALYPTTEITWNIEPITDIMHVMIPMLKYVLVHREIEKGLKKTAEKAAEVLYHELSDENMEHDIRQEKIKEREKHLADKTNHDNAQLVLKKLANSQFGSLGCPAVFPWGDLKAAEKTTCIGRMLLRIMIYYLKGLGYVPIVGDTDGFDFKMPDTFRYTDENPYIGKGLNRYSKKGKAYTKAEADLTEFNDLYLNKCYNGSKDNMSANEIDEYVTSSINLSRKNYLCLMERDGSIKKVGNTMKSRKMSGYLQKFINKACDMLIQGDGHGFLKEYYAMIDNIYNYRIPVRDIASKGNIKKSLDEYKADCNKLTKSGGKKSRQAWYELAIKHNLNVHVGDTVYYVNVGSKKGDGDVKRKVHQFIKNPDNPSEEIELIPKLKTRLLKAECEKEGIEYKSLKTKDQKERLQKYIVREEDEIINNCKLVDNDVLESDKDLLCSDLDIEYNVTKYITQFNNRIKPVLTCFDYSIRDKILIMNPADEPVWTEEQTQLVHGQPMKEGDEDTYEALMTPERKEIEFWLSIGEVPPFVKECNIDWDRLVAEYHETVKKEADELFQAENQKYLKALSEITKEDIEKFNDEGEIPEKILEIVDLSPKEMCFYFKLIPEMKPTTGGYVFDDIKLPDTVETEDEEEFDYSEVR